MANLIAIDPGLKVAGFAMFSDGEFAFGKLVKAPSPEAMWLELCACINEHPDRGAQGDLWRPSVVVEKMHGYAKKQFAINALIDLSILAGRLRPNFMYTYREWAGSLKDAQIFNRVLSRLTGAERNRLPEKLGPHKDVLAAVGIGLHHLGRLKGKGY